MNVRFPSSFTFINFALPPVPPLGNLVVRWKYGTYVTESNRATALIQQGSGPVQVRIPAHESRMTDASENSNLMQLREFASEVLVNEILFDRDHIHTLSDLTTRIEFDLFDRPDLPTEFTLDQNYPNPFNPTTQIRFALPESQQVTIRVFDVNRRMIAELVNNQMYTAGNHQVTFDGTGLSTGVYIYNLTTNSGFTMSRKLVLVKYPILDTQT
jgi:hypothetical protein